MGYGKVANLNYAVFLSFHKLTLENIMYYLYLYSFGKLPLEPVRYTLAKCFYLHSSTTKLDNPILLIAIQLLIFGVFHVGDTVHYRNHAENPMH